jgi:hypothetical protein
LPGNYNFTSDSNDNFIKISKFNTNTLSYDYYNVEGVLSHSYREFHGAKSYSYIGTFNLKAVNKNIPFDVIEIKDGRFRSFQTF